MATMSKPFYVDWVRSLHGVAPDFGEEHFVDPNTATPEQLAAARSAFEEAARTSLFEYFTGTYTYYFDSRYYTPSVDKSTLNPRHDTFFVTGQTGAANHRNDYIDLTAPVTTFTKIDAKTTYPIHFIGDRQPIYADMAVLLVESLTNPTATSFTVENSGGNDFTIKGITNGVSATLFTGVLDTNEPDYTITDTTNGVSIQFSSNGIPAYADIAVALILSSASTATSFTVENSGANNLGFTIKDGAGATLFTATFDSGVYTIADASGASVATPVINVEIPLDSSAALLEFIYGASLVVGSTIEGRGGNDDLTGTYGDDTIYGDYRHTRGAEAGDGSDYIRGLGGNDRLYGGSQGDYIFGGDGDDFIRGEPGNDYLDGGDGDDDIHGGSGDDVIIGGAGDDRIEGHNGKDRIFGGDGDDYIEDSASDSSADVVYGGAGDDQIYITSGGSNTIYGGTGDDIILGGHGNVEIRGGLGNDRILMYRGVDEVWGNGEKASYYGGVLHIGRHQIVSASRFLTENADAIVLKILTLENDGKTIFINFTGGALPAYADIAVALIEGLVNTAATSFTVRSSGDGFTIIGDTDEIATYGAGSTLFTATFNSGVYTITGVGGASVTTPSNPRAITFDDGTIFAIPLVTSVEVGDVELGPKYTIVRHSGEPVPDVSNPPEITLAQVTNGVITATNGNPINIDGFDGTLPDYIDTAVALVNGLTAPSATEFTISALPQPDEPDGFQIKNQDGKVLVTATTDHYFDKYHQDLYSQEQIDALTAYWQSEGDSDTFVLSFNNVQQLRQMTIKDFDPTDILEFDGDLGDLQFRSPDGNFYRQADLPDIVSVADDRSYDLRITVAGSSALQQVNIEHPVPHIHISHALGMSVLDVTKLSTTTSTEQAILRKDDDDGIYYRDVIDIDEYVYDPDVAARSGRPLQEQTRTQLLTTIKIDADDVKLAPKYTITRHSGEPVPDVSNPETITLAQVTAGITHNGHAVTIDLDNGALPDYIDVAVAVLKGLTAPNSTGFTISALPRPGKPDGFQIKNQDGKTLVTATAELDIDNFEIDNTNLDLESGIFEWVETELENGDRIYELWLKDRYALDYETKSSYSVDLELTRSGGDVITDTIAINVQDLVEFSDVLAGRTQIILSADHFDLTSEVGYTVARKLADISHLGKALQDGHEYMVGNEELFEIKQNENGGYELWLKGGVLTTTIASHDSSVYVGERIDNELPDYTDVAVYLIKSLSKGEDGFAAGAYYVEATANGFVIKDGADETIFTGTEQSGTYSVVRKDGITQVTLPADIPAITYNAGREGPIQVEIDPATGRPAVETDQSGNPIIDPATGNPVLKDFSYTYEIDFAPEGLVTYDIIRHSGEPVPDVSNPETITLAQVTAGITHNGHAVTINLDNGALPDYIDIAVAVLKGLTAPNSTGFTISALSQPGEPDGFQIKNQDDKVLVTATANQVIRTITLVTDEPTAGYTRVASIEYDENAAPGSTLDGKTYIASDSFKVSARDFSVEVRVSGEKIVGYETVEVSEMEIVGYETVTVKQYEPVFYKNGGIKSYKLVEKDALRPIYDKSTGHDVIYGDLKPGEEVIDDRNEDNVINGKSGNDTIYGREGDDTIYGGSGVDRLYGNEGDDTIYGGKGDDRIHGNDGDDTLYGGNRHDFIRGNLGNDILDGGKGRDTLEGGKGSDQLYGGGDGLSLDVLIGGEDADYFYLDPDDISSAGIAVVTDFSATDGDKIRINVDDPSLDVFSAVGAGSVAAALRAADNLIYRVVDNWEESVSPGKTIQVNGQDHFRSAHTEFFNYKDNSPYVSSTNDESEKDTVIYYGNGQKIAMVLEDFGGGAGDDLANYYYETAAEFLDFV